MHGERHGQAIKAITGAAHGVELFGQKRHREVAQRFADVVLARPRTNRAADVGTVRRRTAVAAVIVLAALQRQRRVAVVHLLVGQREGGLEILAGRKEQLGRKVGGFLVAHFVAGDGIDVLAPVGIESGGNPVVGTIGNQRSAGPGGDPGSLVLRAAYRNFARKLVGGTAGHVVDGPGVCAASVLRRLRTLDNFHPLDIGEVNGRHIAAHVHAVHKGGNRLYAGDAVNDGGLPAHRRTVLGGAAPEAGLERKARREQRQVIDGLKAQFADIVGRKGADRDGNVLHGLLALAGGDDDFLQHGFLRDCRTRGNDNARSQHEHNGNSKFHLISSRSAVRPTAGQLCTSRRPPLNPVARTARPSWGAGRCEGSAVRAVLSQQVQSGGSPGMRAVMQAPLPGGLATSTFPPCASAIRRHRYRPRPCRPVPAPRDGSAR